jgi:hypothetical protein
MKSFLKIQTPKMKKRPKPVTQQSKWVKPPTPVEVHNPYENICRIIPFYVVDNHEYFELLTPPLNKAKDWEAYVLRIKKKITCMKQEFLL